MKKISIIVPIYNVEKYLRECLDSIVNQDMTLTDYEIILVNDGSTDGSGEIAKEYALHYENVSYYEQKNRGQSVARNLGIEKAVGEYIMFVDSDDYLMGNVLNGIYSEAKKVDADICVGTVKVMKQDGTCIIGRDINRKFSQPITGRDALLNGLVLGSVCARVFRRDCILSNNVGFMPDMKHEDVYFNLSLVPFCERIWFVDDQIYYYRWNEESTDRTSTERSIFRGLLGDLRVAGLAKNLSMSFSQDEKLSSCFRKLYASLIIGNVYSIYRSNKKMNKEYKNQYIQMAKQERLIPIEMVGLDVKRFFIVAIFNAIYGG